jgi:hypothetical protein
MHRLGPNSGVLLIAEIILGFALEFGCFANNKQNPNSQNLADPDL